MTAEIDFEIFSTNDCCDESNRTIDNCACIDRVIIALKYYSTLNIKLSKQGQDTFVNFIETIYTNYLNDIIHLTTIHGPDLQDINQLFVNKYKFKICDINQCTLTNRHCNINNNGHKNNGDAVYTFYQDTFDSIHFYLMHLFDTGLRSIESENDTKQEDRITAFENRKQEIYAKRAKLSTFFEKFEAQKDNKFSIKTQSMSNTQNYKKQTGMTHSYQMHYR